MADATNTFAGQDKLEDVYNRYAKLASQLAGQYQISLPERVFTPQQLQGYIGQQVQQAGQAVPVPDARFQTLDQLSQAVQQTAQILEPYTKSQEEAAKYGYGTALQDLVNQWAARGLLASGAAAAQQRVAAENLGQQLAQIRAQQLAQAIPLALQYGQLGLSEAGQRFNQQMANLQYQQQALANALQGYLSGMGQEETQRQFAQNYALQNLNAYLNALASQQNVAQQLSNIQQAWAQISGTLPSGEPTLEKYRVQTDYLLAQAQQDWNKMYQGKLLDLEQQRLLADQANAQAALKLSTLNTTLGLLNTLGFPQTQQGNVLGVVNYAQSGGAGMSLRNYVASKNGTINYDDSTGKVTINLPGTPTISFVAGDQAQMAALGLGYNAETGQHYIVDPVKFNAFTGSFYGLSSSSSGGSSSSGRGSESWANQQVSSITGKSGSIESQLSGMSQSEKLATLKAAGLID